VVLRSAQILEVLPPDEIRAELLVWLEQGSRRQKRGAALALGILKEAQAAPGLSRLRTSRQERFRGQIARWLRLEIVDLRVVAILALLGIELLSLDNLWTLLADPDPVLRTLAGVALEERNEAWSRPTRLWQPYSRALSPDDQLLVSYGRNLLEERLPRETPIFLKTPKI
jgi:hypothetical protein